MTSKLPDRLEQALAELLTVWQTGNREAFRFTEVPGASGIKVEHQAMTRDWAQSSPAHRTLTITDLRELESAEIVVVDWDRSKNGVCGDLRVTPQGEQYAARIDASSRAAAAGSGTGADWESDLLPILAAIRSIEAGLPPNAYGVSQEAINAELGRPPKDPGTDRQLATLADAGYITNEMTISEQDGPLFTRLTEKALQQVAGWPGGPQANVLEQFLAAIDGAIADPATPEQERGRLQRLRQTSGEVGQSVLTTLLAAFIKDQTGL